MTRNDALAALAAQPGFEPADALDFHDLVGIVADGRRLLLGVMAVVLAAAVLFLWVSPSIYRADAMVQVELGQKTLNSALGDIGELLEGSAPISAEIEIVKSRMVVGDVVDSMNLEIVDRPRYVPLLGAAVAKSFDGAEGEVAPVRFGLDGFAWGGERIEVTTLEVPPQWLGQRLDLRATAAGYDLFGPGGEPLLQGRVGEMAESASGLRIFVRDLVARPGTGFVVERRPRVQVIAEIQRELEVMEKGKYSGILSIAYEHRGPKHATELVNNIARAYQRQNVERRSAEAAQTLAFLNEQLPRLKEKVGAAETALNAYRLKQGSADLTKETELVLQQSVALETSRFELQQKREELMRRFTPDHPSVQALDGQLAQIAREQAAVAARVRALPDTQQELLRLSRDLQVDTELYLSLLNSAQGLQLAKAGTVGNVRIIDPGVRPLAPAKPKKALVLALSLALGFILGIFAILVRRALSQGVDDPAVVERRLGLASYAVIPFSAEQQKLDRLARKGGKRARILAEREPASAAVEALRSLRTALHFALVDAKNRVVVLMGPAPAVGKSFITLNLGAVLAASGKRVVVVDADMRRGHLNSFAGLDRSPGLSDYLAGTAEMAQVVRELPLEGLHLLPTGVLPPNPAELLMGERFELLVRDLAARYDCVLVDTPPVLAVTDAAIIGRLAGSALLVLKAGEHPLRAIEECARRLQAAGVELKGTIFNGVQPRSSRYGYGYGGRYWYAYSYKPHQ
jgi:tyrosine-protein kinase Etk/Wzc